MPNDKVAEVIDLWCDNTKQKSWFIQGALNVILAYIGRGLDLRNTLYFFSLQYITFTIETSILWENEKSELFGVLFINSPCMVSKENQLVFCIFKNLKSLFFVFALEYSKTEDERAQDYKRRLLNTTSLRLNERLAREYAEKVQK